MHKLLWSMVVKKVNIIIIPGKLYERKGNGSLDKHRAVVFLISVVSTVPVAASVSPSTADTAPFSDVAANTREISYIGNLLQCYHGYVCCYSKNRVLTDIK